LNPLEILAWYELLDLLLEAAEGRSEIRTWFKGDRPFLFDHHHDANQRLLREDHQEKRTGRRGTLHARVTVDEHGVTPLVFAEHLVGNFGGPGFHVLDFRRLEIVIDRYSVLKWNGGMEGNLFGTIEDGLDSVFLEPNGILSGFPTTDPDTGYDLICVFFGCSSLRSML
jgi:hypothetical protein